MMYFLSTSQLRNVGGQDNMRAHVTRHMICRFLSAYTACKSWENVQHLIKVYTVN